jgi:bacillithiol system protein YtxJ
MFIRLTSKDELEQLIGKSKEKPIVIFKHSNSCPISLDVRESLEACPLTFHEIIVQTERDLSNAVAEKTGVRHESPQALVIFNEKAVYTAAHYDINGDDISASIESAGGQN